MKLHQIPLTLAAALALGLAGCSQSETSTTASDDANKAAEASRAETAKAVTTGKADATNAVVSKPDGAGKDEIPNVADNSKAQELIDKASSLVVENRLSDASSLLQQLAGQPLSDEQTKAVDKLKEQIQKALVAKTAKDASGLESDLLKR